MEPQVFYASVDMKDSKLVTTSSRTIAVTVSPIQSQRPRKYQKKATQHVKGNLRHRRDIGTDELIQRRLEHVRRLR